MMGNVNSNDVSAPGELEKSLVFAGLNSDGSFESVRFTGAG